VKRLNVRPKKRGLAEDIVAALEGMSKGLQRFWNDFLIAVVEFLEDARKWLAEIARRIADYLSRFFSALFDVLAALAKLALFYIPSVFFTLLAWVMESPWPAFLALAWASAITLIGLTYRKRSRTTISQGTHNPGAAPDVNRALRDRRR
jgi:hypothetical protein